MYTKIKITYKINHTNTHAGGGMNRLLNAYCKALETLCAILMITMVVLVFGNVVLRYAFNTGWLMTEEISRWMFVWMVFLGAIVVIQERGHLGTDLLVARLSVKCQRICLFLAQFAMLYITWLMLTGSWSQVSVNRDTAAPVSGLSVSIFYFSGVLFAISTLLILIEQIWLNVTNKLAAKDLIMVHESEEEGHIALPNHTNIAVEEPGKTFQTGRGGK